MRFYGVPSEERLAEIIERIEDGEWFYEGDGKREVLSTEQVKRKLTEILEEIKKWKSSNSYIPAGTTFFFVHEPQNPKAFKIYDLSSLGCASSLSPPRWKFYLKGLEI
ncbi:MAG: hypothetical protein D6674_01515 [Acidobacteria bacterium]|jgi:hypothetical protein|nr:MAG: hypothetical protein D6674_01515 [Acidobacteriota bacterium]